VRVINGWAEKSVDSSSRDKDFVNSATLCRLFTASAPLHRCGTMEAPRLGAESKESGAAAKT
jgi:hypothetical protein